MILIIYILQPFSPLAGIRYAETIFSTFLNIILISFSPLAGIIGLETIEEYRCDPNSGGFSPLAGIIGLETSILYITYGATASTFQSPCGDYWFRNLNNFFDSAIQHIFSFSPLAGIIGLETRTDGNIETLVDYVSVPLRGLLV